MLKLSIPLAASVSVLITVDAGVAACQSYREVLTLSESSKSGISSG